jgi:hypothetical protein
VDKMKGWKTYAASGLVLVIGAGAWGDLWTLQWVSDNSGEVLAALGFIFGVLRKITTTPSGV